MEYWNLFIYLLPIIIGELVHDSFVGNSCLNANDTGVTHNSDGNNVNNVTCYLTLLTSTSNLAHIDK